MWSKFVFYIERKKPTDTQNNTCVQQNLVSKYIKSMTSSLKKEKKFDDIWGISLSFKSLNTKYYIHFTTTFSCGRLYFLKGL